MVLSESIQVFDRNANEYDLWFDRHPAIFESELIAIQRLLPVAGRGLEIGVGTGRFASRLGIKTGVEPSEEMAKIGSRRGLNILRATAEKLPFNENEFDFALFVTVLCFLVSPEEAIKEAARVVRPGGKVVAAIIDRDSELGRSFEATKESDPFFRSARFLSTKEVTAMMGQVGLAHVTTTQTLFGPLDRISVPQMPKDGDGSGGFVVISGEKL